MKCSAQTFIKNIFKERKR